MRDWEELRKQDERDIRTVALNISSPLHYILDTPRCPIGKECVMCMQAARLAVQYYRPIVEERVIKDIMYRYDVTCELPHPGGD